MSEERVYVSLEFTPNPNTLKYAVNRQLFLGGSASFSSADEAVDRSPLAESLLKVNGIDSVMLGRDFVTITKSESGDWDVVHKEAARTIEDHLTQKLPVVVGELLKKEDVPVEGEAAQIKEIIDREIRPAVAQDGGDIMFERFEDGVVYLELQGSCSGCPSATMTLKMGIEKRLQELVPSVKEVVSVN